MIKSLLLPVLATIMLITLFDEGATAPSSKMEPVRMIAHRQQAEAEQCTAYAAMKDAGEEPPFTCGSN